MVIVKNIHIVMVCGMVSWKLLQKYTAFSVKVSWEKLILFNSNSGGWSQTVSTRHDGHQLAYCTCPGWLWGWRIWWNDDRQGKLKYSEKTCPSATLSTINPTWPDRARTQVAAMGSQWLTAWGKGRSWEKLRMPPFFHILLIYDETVNNLKFLHIISLVEIFITFALSKNVYLLDIWYFVKNFKYDYNPSPYKISHL
jgi:hypothetical protein